MRVFPTARELAAAQKDDGSLVIKAQGSHFPAPYVRMAEVRIDAPGDWPERPDPAATGELPCYKGETHVVLPAIGGDIDRVGAVLVFPRPGDLRGLAEALTAAADERERMHDPGAVRAQTEQWRQDDEWVRGGQG